MPPFPVAASFITTLTQRVANALIATDETLLSVKLPPGILRNIGDTLFFMAANTCAANANNKTSKVTFGNSALPVAGITFTSNGTPTTNYGWITKRGPNQQSCVGITFQGLAGGSLDRLTDLTEDENTPLQVKLIGSSDVAAGDIESRLLQVIYIPAGSQFGFGAF